MILSLNSFADSRGRGAISVGGASGAASGAGAAAAVAVAAAVATAVPDAADADAAALAAPAAADAAAVAAADEAVSAASGADDTADAGAAAPAVTVSICKTVITSSACARRDNANSNAIPSTGVIRFISKPSLIDMLQPSAPADIGIIASHDVMSPIRQFSRAFIGLR